MEHNEQLEIEDIDLLELIMADSNASNQYLVFNGSNDESYAINVSKVVEILVYKDLEMVRNGSSDSLIQATAQIRDNIATIINFDEWFGNEVLDDSEYEYIILAGFGGHNIGIMIKSVEYIVNVDSDNMKDNSKNNPKTNFISKIKLNKVEKLCTIFDCDKLLTDVFTDTLEKNNIEKIENTHNIQCDKIIFFADDSRFIRKLVQSIFDKLQLKYKSFDNGRDLLTELKKTNIDDIGLIVTDIEMPIMDGVTLIKEINAIEEYTDLNIIVHTNLSNFILEKSLYELGTSEIIGKIDMKALLSSISKYIK